MKKIIFLATFLLLGSMAFKIDNNLKNRFINVGDITYDEGSKLYFNSLGKQINLKGLTKQGKLIKVNSLKVVNEVQAKKRLDKFSTGYKVFIDRHMWWGASVYDVGGRVGMHAFQDSFVYRGAETWEVDLYMTEGTFEYRGTEAKSHYFLHNLYQEDPTNTVEVLHTSGPIFAHAN